MKVVRADGRQAHPLDDAKALLDEAQGEYGRANESFRLAAKAHTLALKKLNEAQKAFDAAVNDLRGFAPEESDWKAQERRVSCIGVG